MPPAENETEAPAQKVEASISLDVIKRIQDEAVAQATAAAKKITDEATETAKREARADIVNSLTGGAEDRSDKLLKSLVKDPEAVLNTVVEAAKREALAEFNEKDKERQDRENAERAKTRELAAASQELLKTRPDISASESAKELVNTYYSALPDSMSEAEKIKEAARKYDLFMEKIDGKSAEDRIKAAQSISSNASAPKEAPVQKTMDESAKERVSKAEESWRKKFPNARIPRY